MPQRNQHKPRPPDEVIRGPATSYFEMGVSDVDILKYLKFHYDTEVHGLSVVTLRRLRKQWGLQSTRQQKHTMDTIIDKVREIRTRFPFRGAESIRKALRETYKDHVSRAVIVNLLNQVEPEEVARRRHRGFKRKRFWAAGVNDVWPQDQHDKWGRYGLWLHAGIEAFSGEINWIKIWKANRNPRLMVRYYLETCRRIGGVPILTQSDQGTENNGVANVHTLIRHRIDPTLAGTLQHRFTTGHNNILSEIKWSNFRRDFAPGFEDILESGVHNGWYDVNDILDNLVFRWLAIPWLQAEINAWIQFKNKTAPRAVKNKILPHGIPALIRAHPTQFGALDFKIPVSAELFDEMEAIYAPPNHPIFELVPPIFHQRVDQFYDEAGSPVVTSDSFWDIYRGLRLRFEHGTDDEFTAVLQVNLDQETASNDDDQMPVLPNMKPFRNGQPIGHREQYIGGLHASSSADNTTPVELSPEYVDFTTDDDSEDGE